MNQNSFAQTIRRAMPELEFFDGPHDGPVPDGHTEVGFRLVPTSRGFRLTIKIGAHRANHFTFSSEAEAASFLSRLYAEAQS